MHINLNGKYALVCGSTAGIGRAAAQQMAECGATVTLFARNEERLKETLASLPAPTGQRHRCLIADFADPDRLAEVVRADITAGNTYHILLNNTSGPAGGPVTDADTKAFTDAFSAHLLCNHILAQALLPGMRAAGYGRIINIISTSVKMPLHGLGVSNTIRGAVASWAKTLANEVGGHGITVNNVLPGATATGRLSAIVTNKAKKTGLSEDEVERAMLAEIPAGRFALPEEVAAAAVFLASPLAGYINGINLPVDGGRTGCL